MRDDEARRQLAVIQKVNLVVWPLTTGIAAMGWSPRAAVGVALGGLLGAVNFWLTIQVVRRVFVADPEPRKGGVGMVLVKFFGLFSVVAWLLWIVRPDPIGFGVGFCSILMSIVLKAIFDMVMQKDDANEEHVQELDRHDD